MTQEEYRNLSEIDKMRLSVNTLAVIGSFQEPLVNAAQISLAWQTFEEFSEVDLATLDERLEFGRRSPDVSVQYTARYVSDEKPDEDEESEQMEKDEEIRIPAFLRRQTD